MKKSGLFTFLLCFILSGLLYAKPQRNIGVGFIFGEPTGVSIKIWKSKKSAFSPAIAFGEGFHFHFDYVWHDYTVAKPQEGELPLYYGGGIKIDSHTNRNDETTTDLSIRGVMGLSYIFENSPFDLFFELAPYFKTGDKSSFNLSAAFGFRFYVK